MFLRSLCALIHLSRINELQLYKYKITSMLPVCDGLEDVVMFDLHGAVEVGTGEVTVALLGTLCSWFCVRMEPHVSN